MVTQGGEQPAQTDRQNSFGLQPPRKFLVRRRNDIANPSTQLPQLRAETPASSLSGNDSSRSASVWVDEDEINSSSSFI
ncbi:MAG: hypothetical protein HC848_09445 [Limnobacter sp.]|nr:hypothetical protein [Limnobacter sp.]